MNYIELNQMRKEAAGKAQAAKAGANVIGKGLNWAKGQAAKLKAPAEKLYQNTIVKHPYATGTGIGLPLAGGAAAYGYNKYKDSQAPEGSWTDYINPGSLGGAAAGVGAGALLSRGMSPAKRLGLMLLLGGGTAVGGHYLWDYAKDKYPNMGQGWENFKSRIAG